MACYKSPQHMIRTNVHISRWTRKMSQSVQMLMHFKVAHSSSKDLALNKRGHPQNILASAGLCDIFPLLLEKCTSFLAVSSGDL